MLMQVLPPSSDSSPLGTKRSVPHNETASVPVKELKAELKSGIGPQESSDNKTQTEIGALQSFAHGALGLAEPQGRESVDEPKASSQENVQGYYKAGQLLKAAATVGSVIALFV